MVKFTGEKIKEILLNGTEAEVKELTKGDQNTIEILFGLLEGSDWQITERSANALQMISKNNDLSKQINKLAKRIDKSNTVFEDRKVALYVISLRLSPLISMPHLVPQLIKLVEDSGENEDIKSAACQALGNLGDEKAIDSIIKYLCTPGIQYNSTRNSISYSLSKLVSKSKDFGKWVDQLLDIALKNPENNSRMNAKDVFIRIQSILIGNNDGQKLNILREKKVID
ncbi:MAG: HEAT repeat domain-containing protein [Candidatus Micrarchaeota archaeon]